MRASTPRVASFFTSRSASGRVLYAASWIVQMPRGATVVGLGRSLSFTGAFAGAGVVVVVGRVGSETTGFVATAAESADEPESLAAFGAFDDVGGALVVLLTVGAAVRATFVFALAAVAAPVALWLVLSDGAPAAPATDFGAFDGGADTTPACDAELDVGADAAPVDDVALATFVVGHRPP